MPGTAKSISTSNESRAPLGMSTPSAVTTRYAATLIAAYTTTPRRRRPVVQAYATATSIALTLAACVTL